MTNIIESLRNGSLAPCEKCGANDPQIRELVGLMRRNREELEKQITPGQKEIFQKYIDCRQEYEYLITEQAFRDGFCLASKLLTEALCGY